MSMSTQHAIEAIRCHIHQAQQRMARLSLNGHTNPEAVAENIGFQKGLNVALYELRCAEQALPFTTPDSGKVYAPDATGAYVED